MVLKRKYRAGISPGLQAETILDDGRTFTVVPSSNNTYVQLGNQMILKPDQLINNLRGEAAGIFVTFTASASAPLGQTNTLKVELNGEIMRITGDESGEVVMSTSDTNYFFYSSKIKRSDENRIVAYMKTTNTGSNPTGTIKNYKVDAQFIFYGV